MTSQANTTKAAIFLPADLPEDGLFTQQALMHIERRGYQLACMPLRDWPTVLHILRERLATVIVVARSEHLDPGFEPRVEVVGEETQRLCLPPKESGNDKRNRYLWAGGRHRRPRPVR